MSIHRPPVALLSSAPKRLLRHRGPRVVSAACGVALLACLQACGGGQTEVETPSANGPTSADLQREWVDRGDHQHLALPKKGQQ